MKALSQLITKWRAFEIFLKCSFEKIRQKPGNECKHRLLPHQSLTVLKFIEEKNNKWSEATNSAMRQRMCACTRCLVFLFLSRFYTGQISKEPSASCQAVRQSTNGAVLARVAFSSKLLEILIREQLLFQFHFILYVK